MHDVTTSDKRVRREGVREQMITVVRTDHAT
jgi:hypothetical protein